MYEAVYMFLIFMIYSILGWIVDITGYWLDTQKITNRGFLIGPYCPIYGISSIFMVYCLGQYKNDTIVLFVMAALICSIMEYLTSYIMEKLFHARWWDYSKVSFNLNGRICLKNTIAFGFLSILLLKFINPFFSSILSKIPNNILIIIGIVLIVLFITDICISFNIINKLKIATDNIKKDNSEEITREVKKQLISKSKLSRRLLKAFPNFEALSSKVKKIFDK